MSKVSRSDMILWLVTAILVLLVSIAIPFLYVDYKTGGTFEFDFEAEADATIVNGILTADAIIFGFVTFDLRRIGSTTIVKFLLVLPLIIALVWTVLSYFVDGVTLGYPTMDTLLIATIAFFINVLYYVFILALIKAYNVEAI